MNTVDIVLAIIFLIAFIVGFKSGFFSVITSLIGVIAGIYGAFYLSGYAEAYLSDWFHWTEQVTSLVAFAVTFILIVVAFSMLGTILTKIANIAFLGIINKLLGGFFNVLKYAFIISVCIMIFNKSERLRSIVSEEDKSESILYGPVATLAPLLLPTILKEVETIRRTDDDPYLDAYPTEDTIVK